MYENLAYLAAFAFFYSIISGGLERTPINGALVFAAFGAIFGPLGFGVLALDVTAEGLRSLAELTLALVLFSDAANADLGILLRSIHIPQRLLLLGLPLTILLGFALGALIFDTLTLPEAAILATMLAPTDAALGKAVVTDAAVPSNIRESLNAESGLNDGICVPVLFLFLALATEADVAGGTPLLALKLVSENIGIGLAVGLGLTLLGSQLLAAFIKHGWIPATWRQLPVVSLAIACFAAAQALGGSGFIAAFAGGLLFGRRIKQHKHALLLAAESNGDMLALLTWVIFGAGVIGKAIAYFDWQVILYSLLSLTLIRIVPVFSVLAGMNLRSDEKLFMGWFGPRGLASIVFGVIVMNEHLPGGGTIVVTVVCTVLLSIIAHGLSAAPLVAVLARRLARSGATRASADKP
ncbi:MAG: cation:proton antiporter domain-containing protein [Gammaproteobacteria bacterium]